MPEISEKDFESTIEAALLDGGPDIDEDISATGMSFGIPARPSKEDP